MQAQSVEIVDRIEVFEPPATCDVHGGTFSFTNKQGRSCVAEFYVRTCTNNTPDHEDPQVSALRVDAYNQQYTDACNGLMASGCTDIAYKETSPSEFF